MVCVCCIGRPTSVKPLPFRDDSNGLDREDKLFWLCIVILDLQAPPSLACYRSWVCTEDEFHVRVCLPFPRNAGYCHTTTCRSYLKAASSTEILSIRCECQVCICMCVVCVFQEYVCFPAYLTCAVVCLHVMCLFGLFATLCFVWDKPFTRCVLFVRNPLPIMCFVCGEIPLPTASCKYAETWVSINSMKSHLLSSRFDTLRSSCYRITLLVTSHLTRLAEY